MFLTGTSVCAALAIGIFLLVGCRQETPQNKQSTKTAPTPQANQARQKTGEELFKQYCSPCHPDGGNVTNRQKTLRGPVLRKNNISSPEAIVGIMRHPTSRMIRFDETTLPDKDAMAIAEYVLKRFQ